MHKSNSIWVRMSPNSILGMVIKCVRYKWSDLSPKRVSLSYGRDCEHNDIHVDSNFQFVVCLSTFKSEHSFLTNVSCKGDGNATKTCSLYI